MTHPILYTDAFQLIVVLGLYVAACVLAFAFYVETMPQRPWKP